MMRFIPAGATLAFALTVPLVTPLDAQLTTPMRAAPTRLEVAPGIYLFQTERYGDAGLDGNSVVIISDDGVVVFDANGTPNAATAVLAEIRKLTSQPVKYLVLSHWHWDHWYGAEVYKQAFPAVEIIGHERTKAMMAGPAIAFNQPALDRDYPNHIKDLESALEKAKTATRADTAVARLEVHVALDRWFLGQKVNARHTLPTRTFTDSLTLTLGRRTITILHVDRAITPGDAFLWLPRERIAVVADLLINPMTYGLFCYPS